VVQDAKALECLEIGTWMMPLVAMGAYDTLIWVTKWANIPKETFVAWVGYDDKDKLRITGKSLEITHEKPGAGFPVDPWRESCLMLVHIIPLL
jgi:hypothetical protein